MSPPPAIFDHCHGVVPLRPRLEEWMADLITDRPRLHALADDFGAPLNIQCVAPFRRNIAALTACVADFGLAFLPMFARKANKCLTYVDAARDLGIGIDTASRAEVEQCLARGVPGHTIVCTAAVKDRALMDLCVAGGVTVVLDNSDELELLEDVVSGRGRKASVALRLNGFRREGAAIYSRFGFALGEIPRIAARLSGLGDVSLDGLHFHLDGYSAEDRIAAISQTLPLIEEIRDPARTDFFLDIGGGTPMNYLSEPKQWDIWLAELDKALAGERDPITQHNDSLGRKKGPAGGAGSIDSYPVAQPLVQGDWMRKILQALEGDRTIADRLRDAGVTLRSEPGRSLLDGCGMTVARVAFCKVDSAGMPVVGVQMNRTQSRSGFAEFALDPLLVPGDAPRDDAVEGYLAGTYCTESEWLTRRKMFFPDGARPGDLMVFPNTAGYLMHFLESRSHQFPLAENVFVQPDSESDSLARAEVDQTSTYRTRAEPRSSVMSAEHVVRGFFERMQARDWDGAGELLSPGVHIEFTETGERFDGPRFLAMNRAYPDGWSIDVVEAIASGDRVATQVRVKHGEMTFWCAGFYSVAGTVIESGIEHWVTERSEPPPAWRQAYVS